MRISAYSKRCLALFQSSIRRASTKSYPADKTAAEAVSYLTDHVAGKVIARRQLIDANQLEKLALTLGRPIIGGYDVRKERLPNGMPVPAGHHLVYFTPSALESELGPDGSDRTFNTPAPFSRRMWAGGSMTFFNEKALKIGEEAEEITRLISATAKKSRSTGEMVLVEVEKELHGSAGLAVRDRRSWVFRPTIDPSLPLGMEPRRVEGDILAPSLARDLKPDGDGFATRTISWSPVALFRFSGLTFNSHKIHYNEDWTRTAEGHPGIVVHGPLNVISLLEYWKDVHSKGNGVGPDGIAYRAMSPVYAGERYGIRTGEIFLDDGRETAEVVAERENEVIMSAIITKAK